MAGRPRSWLGYEEQAVHKVTVSWPSLLWKDLQRVALDEDTTATALAIQAVEMLLKARRKERSKKRTGSG
jgi:hypothetical protein